MKVFEMLEAEDIY